MGGSSARASLTARLAERRPEIEQAVLARVHAVADPAEVDDPAYAAGLYEAVCTGVGHGLAALESPEAVPVPATLLHQARYAARSGVPLDTVLRRYFAGYTLLGDYLLREAAHGAPLGAAELQRLSRAQAHFFDRLLIAVSREYREMAQALASSLESTRAERVRRLLAGEAVDVEGIGYDLEGRWHLGAVAAGPGARSALYGLAARLPRAVLAVDGAAGAVWAWLGGERRLTAAEALRRVAREWPEGVALAFGEPGEGVMGWRQTHRQALAALPVARLGGGIQLAYAEVALLAAALGDEVLARSLRESYLAPLEGERENGAALREALRAYFAADRNVSSAAAALGLSRQTIARRLAAAEERIGRPIGECAPELETALRLEQVQALPRAIWMLG